MTKTAKTIMVVEPQCRGYEHVRFNAALIATIAEAYPGCEIEFLSEREHGGAVVHVLSSQFRGPLVLRTVDRRAQWPPIAWLRMAHEYGSCREVLARFRENGADLLVYSSVSAQTLIALKRLLPTESGARSVAAIPHAVLNGLSRPSRRLWNAPINIEEAVRHPSPENLRCLALSQSILDAVTALCGAAGWRRFNHPYLFDEDLEPGFIPPAKACFGIFGALRSQMEAYCDLAECVTERSPGVKFVLVGHCQSGERFLERLARSVDGVGTEPVSNDEYRRRARSITHAVFLSAAAHYRYTASNGILDAFNYRKPIICFRNPLVDEYTAAMGEIGYSLDTFEELKAVVLALSRQIPAVRYREQVEAIAGQRARYAPSNLAGQFRSAVER